MPGLGETTPLQLLTAQVELPTSIDGIVEKVREILTKGGVQSVSIKEGEPIIYQRYATPGEEVSDPLEEWTSDVTLADIYRNIEMEEFDLKEQGLLTATPQTILFWAIFYIEHENFIPSYLMVSKDSDFWPWLGLSRRQGRKLDRFMGLKIERSEVVPNSTVILFGAGYTGAGVTDVQFALKLTAEVTNAQVDRKVTSSGSDPNSDGGAPQVLEQPTG
jgi:hypothetical protein